MGCVVAPAANQKREIYGVGLKSGSLASENCEIFTENMGWVGYSREIRAKVVVSHSGNSGN